MLFLLVFHNLLQKQQLHDDIQAVKAQEHKRATEHSGCDFDANSGELIT